MGDSGLVEWLIIFRAVQVIVQSSQNELHSGPLSAMFTAGERKWKIREEHASKSSSAVDQLGHLRCSIQQSLTDLELLPIYMGAIKEVQKSFAMTYSGGLLYETVEYTDVFIFSFCVSEEYLVLLKAHTQEALAIFAYFCVIEKRTENKLWSLGRSEHLTSQIYTLLDAEHKLWVRWPVEEAGFQPEALDTI